MVKQSCCLPETNVSQKDSDNFFFGRSMTFSYQLTLPAQVKVTAWFSLTHKLGADTELSRFMVQIYSLHGLLEGQQALVTFML